MKDFQIRKDKKYFIIIIIAAFCLMDYCSQSPVYAESAKGTVTQGTEKYRGFLVDNVYHSTENGDIHYHSYFPDSYDSKKKMALYVTLPGYQGLYFQGVAKNLKTEEFAFEARKYNKDMIILAPQLEDWEETSADQTIALVEYFLDNYPINPARVYINGYSGGGETLSLVLSKQPELFAGALMCSSQWDGEYEPVTKAKTPVYFVIGEDDEYYSQEPFKDAYKKLYGIYQNQGLSEQEIGKLLVLDIKGDSYFEGTEVTYQHGGGILFCRDKEIMGWLFAQKKTAAEETKYSIALNKSIYTLKKGKAIKLKAALNQAAKKNGIEWKVSNPKVASVSKTGKVTAKKNGKTIITAKVKGTKTKAGCRIIVGTPVSKLKLNQKSVSLTAGQKFTLKTTISPKKASVKKASYKSSNRKVATVSKKGVIRAVSVGQAKIRVMAADGSGKKVSCTVQVTETVPVAGVALNKTQLDLKIGDEEMLTATVNPSNAADPTVRWSSSDPTVVQVSDNGTVKAIAEGAAVITASAHNHVHADCSVTVESASKQPAEPEQPMEPEQPTEPETPSVSGKVTKDTTVSEIINDPAFGDFGRLLFPVDRVVTGDMTLEDISSSSVYIWYSNIKTEKTVEIVNDLKSRSEDGEQIFHRIYSEEEMKADPEKRDTGLFYFKGNPGAKYAILNAGGGFVYVGAMHDSFPHALEVSKKGYHAFALIYRPDSAYEDLAQAIAYVNDHAKEFGIDAEGYSLWGGSAGARMAATLGNAKSGPANYGRPDIPQASAVIMQYTGYTDASADDAPTYACVGTRDGIANYRTMESRLAKLSSLGIPTEFHAYEGLGHGFGLGTGTVAEGWIEDAIAFWESQVRTEETAEKNTLLTASPNLGSQQVLYVWEEWKAPATTVYTQNNGNYFDDPDFRPYVTAYPAAEGIPIKGAVVICAGGAFQYRSDENEGTPIALELSRLGYQSFVLDYRLRPYTQEEGALDLARTVRFIRRHANEYGIDEKDIAVMGFSAGGILAGEMILHYGHEITPDALDPSYVPDALDRVSAEVAADGMIYSFYGRLSVASMDLESLQKSGFPPTYYCYGTNDPFYRQFEAQFSLLENAGERVERLVLENWGHGFGSRGNWMADYDRFLTEIFENN